MGPGKKCHVCSFIIKFKELHEKAAQHYQVEEFYIVFKEILLLQEDALKLEPMLQAILTKEYQFKNSYQGKYCDPNNIYGPWYIESTMESYTKHLFVFNLFDKNNNYERIKFEM